MKVKSKCSKTNMEPKQNSLTHANVLMAKRINNKNYLYVHIPAKISEFLDLEKDQRVLIWPDGDTIVIKKMSETKMQKPSLVSSTSTKIPQKLSNDKKTDNSNLGKLESLALTIKK